jgi:hypothetical protein
MQLYLSVIGGESARSRHKIGQSAFPCTRLIITLFSSPEATSPRTVTSLSLVKLKELKRRSKEYGFRGFEELLPEEHWNTQRSCWMSSRRDVERSARIRAGEAARCCSCMGGILIQDVARGRSSRTLKARVEKGFYVSSSVSSGYHSIACTLLPASHNSEASPLSPARPGPTPRNVPLRSKTAASKCRVFGSDAEEPWTSRHKFDHVHGRTVLYCF